MSSSIAMPSVERPPRVRVAPSFTIDDGLDACDFAAAYGYEMDDWQQDVLRCWLGRTDDDKYAAKTCGILCPRQQGKNAILEVRELFGAVVLHERILHTAHEVKTAMKAFQRLKRFFGEKANDPKAEYPELNALVKRIRNTNGQEAIELWTGGSVEFSARSTGAARGFTVDVTIYDEAQALTDAHINASLPAKSAAPSKNPQTIYTGTPPTYGSPAEVFGRIRKNASAGEPRMCWHEWSVAEIGDVTDRSRWYACNPAMPHRVTEEAVEEELQNMSADGFAMERLCWWPEQASNAAIPAGEWDACGSDEPAPDGLICYAVKFSPDGMRGTLAVCSKPEDGKPRIEVVEARAMSRGISWFADWLEARKGTAAQITIDGMSNAQPLIDELLRRGVSKRAVVRPRPADMASACSLLLNGVHEGKLTHYRQEALDQSAKRSKKRHIGNDGGWGFADNDSDATLIEACALAYWGAMTTKRNPARQQRMMF